MIEIALIHEEPWSGDEQSWEALATRAARVAKHAPRILAGLGLDPVAVVEELEHRLLVGDVAEVGGEHRVECLRDEPLDVAESLDHARGTLVVDVDHHRERQGGLVGVTRHQFDALQALVVAVRLAPPRHPVEDEVRGRHEDDVAGVGVEGVLARAEGPLPHAALPLGDALAATFLEVTEEIRKRVRPGSGTDTSGEPKTD